MAKALLQAAGLTSETDNAPPQAKPSHGQRRTMPSRKAKAQPVPDEEDDDGSDFELNEDEETEQLPPQRKSRTNSKSKTNNTVSPIAHADEHAYHCTYTRSCTCTYKTRTGLRKHINAAHTHAITYACPYPGCNFARPAKETIIRHLQGKHSMPELPLKKKGQDWEKVEKEQIRVFKEYVGQGVDVGFFLTLGTAEDGEGEKEADAADEEHKEGDEGLFVDDHDDDDDDDDDDEATAEQSDDSDVPLANRTRSATKRNVTQPPINTTTQPPEDVHKFDHTSDLHISLLRYSAALTMDSTSLNWPKLWDLLAPEGTDRDEFKRFCETNDLVRRFGEKSVAGIMSKEMEYWLMRYPFVEVSLSKWLGERLEEM